MKPYRSAILSADSPIQISRRAVLLSLAYLPATLAGCGGGGGGAVPSPSRTLPQEFSLAYRVEPPGASEGRVSRAIAVTADGILLLTQLIPPPPEDTDLDIFAPPMTGVLTGFTNYGIPGRSGIQEVLRIPPSEGNYFEDLAPVVTSANEIYVPGRLLERPGDVAAPAFFALSTQGTVPRAVVGNVPVSGTVECPDGTFVGRGFVGPREEKERIVRTDAQGNYLNTVMEAASRDQYFFPGTGPFFRTLTPAVTPSGDVYVYCIYANGLGTTAEREGFLTAKLDGSGGRFIPVQKHGVFAHRAAKYDGAMFSDGEGNLYVEALTLDLPPEPRPLATATPTPPATPEAVPTPTPPDFSGGSYPDLDRYPRRAAVHKFAPDGTELGAALLPSESAFGGGSANRIDAAVDATGNIYAISDAGAIYVYKRTR